MASSKEYSPIIAGLGEVTGELLFDLATWGFSKYVVPAFFAPPGTASRAAGLVDDMTELIAKYGDDVLEYVAKYGDDAADWIRKYGDDAMEALSKYGDDAAESLRSASRAINGSRTNRNYQLTDAEIGQLRLDIQALEADESIFTFNTGKKTGYNDDLDLIRVKGDVLPDLTSKHPRDQMSSRAVLAHEYYGHRAYRGTPLEIGSWNDEFRASYMAAKNAPGLSPDDRYYLILDALERAREANIPITNNDFMNSILYGGLYE